MTNLKQYTTLLLPMIAILISIHLYNMINKLSNQYTNNINKQYSIIISSKGKLEIQSVLDEISMIKSLTLIKLSSSLKQFKNILSENKYKNLSKTLPYFYEVKLKYFPTDNDLKNIKSDLSQYDYITRVETFMKKHSSFTMILINAKQIAYYFNIIIVLLGSVLLYKLIQVWDFQHSNKIEVMRLFGASQWQRSKELINISLVSSIISSTFVTLLFSYIYNNAKSSLLVELGINKIHFNVFLEFIYSLTICSLMSIILVLFITIKNK